MDLIDLYSRQFNIPYEAAKALIQKESAFNTRAISKKGAQGLTQLMPITQKEMGVTDPFDPEQSIKGGLGYYAKQRERFGPIGALYAYNWGPKNYSDYLAGSKTTIPKETEKYVNTLAPLFGPTAPMDLQGRPQVPETLPVSQSLPPQETQSPQTIPPQSTGAPQMDEYESMKIFNPYVQMALGMLAGNSGATKSQAFANAMGGGLNAVQTAQTNQQRQSAASREAEMHKLKLDEYARMQASVKNARAFAAKMAEKGGPMADYWKGVSETDDPSAIMKMGALQAEFEQQANRNRYNDIMEKQYMNPTQKQQSYTLPSKQDVLSGHSMLMEDPEFGEKYKELSTDQQKAIASKYATAAKALADKGDPDPWNSARAVIGTLPEANLNMLQKFGKGLKENAEGVVESFKEVLGW